MPCKAVRMGTASFTEDRGIARPHQLLRDQLCPHCTVRDSGDDQFHASHQEGEGFTVSDYEELNSTSSGVRDANETSSTSVGDSEGDQASSSQQVSESPVRRSTRQRKSVQRLTATRLGNLIGITIIQALATFSSYFSEMAMTPANYGQMNQVQQMIDQRAQQLMGQPIQKSDGSVAPMPFDTAQRIATEQVAMELRAGQVY